MHLFSQSRGKLAWDEAIAAFVPGTSVQAERSAGACRGSFALADCLADGHDAGWPPPPSRLRPALAPPRAAHRSRITAPLPPLWVVPSAKPVGENGKHFVDLQNDVTAADVALAPREGYRSVEHLKRYTTIGMGTDQGKTTNVNALGIMAEAHGTLDSGGRHHHLPPALYAGRPSAPSPATSMAIARPDPPHADPPLARGRRGAVRECRPVAPRLVLPEARREHARRGQPRGQRGARRRRAGRRLDARQDRHQGPRRGRVARTRLHQQLEQAGGRPLALRRSCWARTAWSSTTAPPRGSASSIG